MSVEVIVDLSRLEAYLSDANMQRVRGIVTEEAAQDSNVYCPVDTGKMQNTQKVDIEAGEFAWVMPYSVYAYNADSVHTVKNPKATPHPFETAKEKHLNRWAETAVKSIFEA